MLQGVYRCFKVPRADVSTEAGLRDAVAVGPHKLEGDMVRHDRRIACNRRPKVSQG